MQTNLSATSRSILTALLAGSKTSKVVAAELNINVPVVTGSLAGLKKAELVSINDTGALELTAAGINLVVPKLPAPPAEVIVAAEPAAPAVDITTPAVTALMASKGDKKAAAKAIIASMAADSKRKAIVTRLQTELQMSAAMASTYHYNLVHGMWK